MCFVGEGVCVCQIGLSFRLVGWLGMLWRFLILYECMNIGLFLMDVSYHAFVVILCSS